jgi:sRNA-binding carbon storage regulator CsrA
MGFRKRIRQGDKIITSNGVEVEIEHIGFDSIEVFISAPKNVKIDTPMGAATEVLKELRRNGRPVEKPIPQPTVPQPVKWQPISHKKLHATNT